MQWDSLESYFLSNFDLDDDPNENDPNEKHIREKRMVNAFKLTGRKLYVMFIQSVIPIFGSFNSFLKTGIIDSNIVSCYFVFVSLITFKIDPI